MTKKGYILRDAQFKHDRQFPERYAPSDIESRKLSALFVKLQIELEKDMNCGRNLVPGLRMAMNLLIDLDNTED